MLKIINNALSRLQIETKEHVHDVIPSISYNISIQHMSITIANIWHMQSVDFSFC